MVGKPNMCPTHKRVFMKDGKYAPGDITQTEVLEHACPKIRTSVEPDAKVNTSTAVTVSTHSGTEKKESSPKLAPRRPSASNINDWYTSPVIIKCTAKDRINGFVADPRDCSKYYRCENNFGSDTLSIGGWRLF
jgi:hypothetical protein